MRGGAVVLLAFLLAVPLGGARAACVDPSAIVPARAAIDAACPCAASLTVRAYRDCAKGVIEGLITHGQLAASCARDVRRCVRGSTCGRPGMGTCCRVKCGKVQCQVTTAARCAARGGCVGVLASCCEACGPAGCATTTTTTTLPAVCGNGVVDPGEQCDGQVFCVNCRLPIYACCDVAVSGGGVCSRDFYPEPGPPFCLDQGSVTHLGTVPANGPACPEAGFNYGEGACGPPTTFPPTTFCCTLPGPCLEMTVSDTQGLVSMLLTGGLCELPFGTHHFAVGTCGPDMQCHPG